MTSSSMSTEVHAVAVVVLPVCAGRRAVTATTVTMSARLWAASVAPLVVSDALAVSMKYGEI